MLQNDIFIYSLGTSYTMFLSYLFHFFQRLLDFHHLPIHSTPPRPTRYLKNPLSPVCVGWPTSRYETWHGIWMTCQVSLPGRKLTCPLPLATEYNTSPAGVGTSYIFLSPLGFCLASSYLALCILQFVRFLKTS